MLAGVEVKTAKLRIILLASLLAGSAVSFVGVIGFVDLIAPHIVRRYLGATHRWLIPGSAILGGTIMVLGDTIARTILSPREIPIGAVTALIGAPFFLYIYFKKGRCCMIELKTAVTLQQTPILKDISLVFPTGSKTCILGPNGCGKTTLLKTIAGLVPYSGSVLIDGQEVHGQKRKELATKVAMMSQFTTVAFDYTVYETVLMGAYRQQAQRFYLLFLNKKKNESFII